MKKNNRSGKRKRVNFNSLYGRHYVCSNEKCHNEIRMNEDMRDRKIMCTKCNAGFLITRRKKQQQAGYVIQTGKNTGVRVKAGEKQVYAKSFRKWKQLRVRDGVRYPVHNYNIRDLKTGDKEFDSLVNTQPPEGGTST